MNALALRTPLENPSSSNQVSKNILFNTSRNVQRNLNRHRRLNRQAEAIAIEVDRPTTVLQAPAKQQEKGDIFKPFKKHSYDGQLKSLKFFLALKTDIEHSVPCCFLYGIFREIMSQTFFS